MTTTFQEYRTSGSVKSLRLNLTAALHWRPWKLEALQLHSLHTRQPVKCKFNSVWCALLLWSILRKNVCCRTRVGRRYAWGSAR
ncbi:uncharacterized protein BDV14DRAFT_123621 [Aspergillus stella-maris]|uniref:uncharacterized protein n=1 Tax=Aspergillus stella-maris TaxID=1810926 RepID=UPI003CCCDC6B